MQAIEEQVRPEFKGTKKNKELASRVFDVTSATARFFSHSAPVRIGLTMLAEHFADADGDNVEKVSKAIDKALTENDHVFLRDEADDEVYFVTTRSGLPPVASAAEDSSHSFPSRFMEPPPIPEFTAPRRRPQRPPEETDIADLQDYVGEGLTGGVSDVEAEPADAQAEPADTPAEPVETISDISEATDDEIAEALNYQLAYDYSVANFGDAWMAEDKVPRLSRGDLRRIKDYIGEQDAPVSDHQIVRDLLGIRQNAQEYELHLFSVNFRLSRETRDFEFVGIPGAHYWTTAGIEAPTVAKRKASEVGQDYRVLLDLPAVPVTPEEGVIEHVLTFYEHRHGVLPLDAAFSSIIPGPVLQGQRSAIIRFESPLTNESFPIEVRFPTGNRGGFLAGFAEFFGEHLVPGAFLTIEAADEPGKYTIEFLTVSGQDRKLLVLDEKKNQYQFESRTFYCAPNEDMLISENRFPKLAGTAPLDERTRRQPELVLARAFEHVGERVDAEGDGQLMAVLDELVGAANIERPLPAELIRAIATSDDHPEFSLDPEADDVIYYRPGTDA